jgi:NADH-quinone oxidoreductase subunit C
VSGYIGMPGGRDLNKPSTQGFQRLPQPKSRRFAVNYHLLALQVGAPRVRLQVWLDEGEPVSSLVSVWPTADWHEREAWDLMGIQFTGHPNPRRILMEDDWEGHPLRKDYPIGGEPVRFSGEE